MFLKKKEDRKQKANENLQKETYAGIVIKCPACHMIVSSLMLECPACHTQLNHEPNQYVLKFSKEIEKFENSNEIKKRVRTFLGTNKIYSISNKFSLSEMKEVNYINEFTVPSDQASFYEFMIYIKTKMESIFDNHKWNGYKWSKVWLNKAKAIREKSNLLLPNDEYIENKYLEITSIHKKLAKKNALIIFLICFGAFLFIGFIITMIVLSILEII